MLTQELKPTAYQTLSLIRSYQNPLQTPICLNFPLKGSTTHILHPGKHRHRRINWNAYGHTTSCACARNQSTSSHQAFPQEQGGSFNFITVSHQKFQTVNQASSPPTHLRSRYSAVSSSLQSKTENTAALSTQIWSMMLEQHKLLHPSAATASITHLSYASPQQVRIANTSSSSQTASAIPSPTLLTKRFLLPHNLIISVIPRSTATPQIK